MHSNAVTYYDDLADSVLVRNQAFIRPDLISVTEQSIPHCLPIINREAALTELRSKT